MPGLGTLSPRTFIRACLRALGDEFVERVLEEDAFEAVARVARRSLTHARFRLGGVVALGEDAERQPLEECARGVECEVDGVIGEGADLEAKSRGVPSG